MMRLPEIYEMQNQKLNLFSHTLDEWTSIQNKMHLNINIHGNGVFWNLGLIRIRKGEIFCRVMFLFNLTEAQRIWNKIRKIMLFRITTEVAP